MHVVRRLGEAQWGGEGKAKVTCDKRGEGGY